MFGRSLVLSARSCKTVSICLLIILVVAGTVIGSQKAKQTHWHYPSLKGYEKGNIGELKDKRRVYLSFFIVGVSPQDLFRTSYQQRILNQLSRDGVLEVVEKPEDAELAVYIQSYERESFYEFYVLTRGEQQRDGGYKPHVVLKRLRSDSTDSTMLIEQTVNAFVDDMKALRGGK